MIEFLCPEGHKIRCPAEKAGRPAKCPKCGVGFRIPTLEELGLADSAAANADAPAEEVGSEPAASPSPSGSGKQSSAAPAAPKEEQIEFLCPNGHHLHGPASLQGKAGECPECGSRFRIPIIEEADADTPGQSQANDDPGAPVDDEIILESSSRLAEMEESGSAEPLDFLQVLESGISRSTGMSASPGGSGGSMLDMVPDQDGAQTGLHPLAAIFIEFWALRDEGSRVEIHLESGSVLLPDAYVKSHSQHEYAVLVTKDPDGCSTVTVVAWSSIARIILRALKDVPGEVVR